MQERQVTVGDETHMLPNPFLVLATQNPIEQEGTYALPEAQLDRFMLMVKVGYPTKEDERAIMDRMTAGTSVRAAPVAGPKQIIEARSVLSQIYIDEKIRDYIVNIVHATREPKAYGLAELADFIQFGASPRASIYLNLAARAHAFLRRRGYVTPEDIKAVGADVLRHRVILTYEAEAEEMTSEQVVRKLFEHIEVP
jgi:MoxR-like ATPase